MSTRANIIIKDKYDKLFFYRHSDGYPEGVLPTLNKFMKWVKTGKIRNNVRQSAGWLIYLGQLEYGNLPTCEFEKDKYADGKGYGKIETLTDPYDWKVGAYEPTTCIHGDIEYLYIIDLTDQTLKCFEDWTDKGVGKKELSLPA